VKARPDPAQAVVVSASRTRDLVGRCPDLLADMIRGRADVRTGRRGAPRRMRFEEVGALVLWTKHPAGLVSRPLLDALGSYVRSGGLILLQLTVTGFGGSPVEPGVPHPEDAARALARALDSGIVEPRAVKLRYDPVGSIRFGGSLVYSNARLVLLGRVLDLFQPLGVSRVTASELDHVHYPAVTERISSVGGEIVPVSRDESISLMRAVSSACRSRGLAFSTCVNPYDPDLVDSEGCIDGRVTNSWSRRPVWDALHNAIGSQRPHCRCTYSLDIGSSPGVTHCTTGGSACLYCYACGPGLGSAGIEVSRLLEEARRGRDPSWARVAQG